VDSRPLDQTSLSSLGFDRASKAGALALGHLEALLVEVPFEGEVGVPFQWADD
jgi:hypothetical protein